ncbi:beta-mannosidase [Paenibacillus baekrokdamisoli]|nr:sugar-binding domain-containing protein [Paenibacillus baekrokdamisoli]MBB3067894.1 beta-mannosidase [Paenibacillus baekrokdamisoli]
MNQTRAVRLSESLSLNGEDWKIRCENEAGDESFPFPGQDGGEWISATVPGNIQADLERARKLKPLWYGEGDPRLLEVARQDWWYRKDFDAPVSMTGKRIKLYLDGVDYACEVWLNGSRLGTHEGMFQRFDFDVTDVVRTGERNRLEVKISRMPEEILPYLIGSDGKMSGDGTPYFFVEANNKTRQVLKGLKSPANFSYDWGTNIWTLGIWKDVRLEASGPAKVEWVQVQTRLSEQYRKATVVVRLEVDSTENAEVAAIFHVSGNGISLSADIKAQLKKGSNMVEGRIELPDPELWWPNGYGDQPLYVLTSELVLASNSGISDRTTTRFGVRDVRWEQVEGAAEDFPNPFRLILNGRPIRTMGSNLVAPDLLYGRIGDRGRHFIQMAKACHMNTLRQHGGQVIFPDSLYDAADELGLMLLVDFPIANCVPENEPVFLHHFEETIRNIVKQLRNHPSIIEWSGGNELEWYFKQGSDHTALRVQEKAVSAEDDRLFRATCPIQGSRHAPWDYIPELHYKQFNVEIKDNFGVIPMMRYGEVGCQTPANLEVWHRDIPPASQWPINEEDPVLIRKNAVNAVFSKDMWLAKGTIEQLFGELDGLESLIKGGQFIGAEGVRYIIDALRAKGEKLGGFTTWDYNEPWPNGAGSFMIDYDGRPLMKYYFVKQALAPLTLQLKYDSLNYDMFDGKDIELLLVSDAAETASKLNWSWTARDRRGEAFAKGQGTACISPHEVVSLDQVNLLPPMATRLGPIVVELALRDASGEMLAERAYVFGMKGAKGPLRGLLNTGLPDHDYGIPYVTTCVNGGVVTRTEIKLVSAERVEHGGEESLSFVVANIGGMTAMFCELHSVLEYRTDLFIDNNFISIPPGETRVIKVCASSVREGLSLSQTGWEIRCWNADILRSEPSPDVVLSMGRLDSMTREYAGSLNEEVNEGREAFHEGRRIDPANVSYLVKEKVAFSFEAEAESARSTGKLRIHTADQASEKETLVAVYVNETSFTQKLQPGFGIQKADPAHLAFPKTLVFDLPAGTLHEGKNMIRIEVKGGWFSWDALDLVLNK